MKKIFTIGLLSLVFSLFALKTSAECTVYIIMDLDLAVPTVAMNINGKHVCDLELQYKKTTAGLDLYKKAVKKFIFNTEDKYTISYDLTWINGVPHHEEININTIDGETYYIQLFQKKLGKGAWQFKPLKEKDAMKKLKKTDDYDLLPDYIHPTK